MIVNLSDVFIPYSDVSKIQDGLGDKLASFLRYSAQFFGGYIVGFIYGWELTLVITAASPLIMISGAIMSQVSVVSCNYHNSHNGYNKRILSQRPSKQSSITQLKSYLDISIVSIQLGVALTQKELNAYAKAGSIAEEVLSSIRTVVAFGGEQKECSRYVLNLIRSLLYTNVPKLGVVK